MTRPVLIACLLVPLVLAAGRAAADPEADALREQLRQTVLQLRQLQDQVAATTAAPAPAPDADSQKKLGAAQAEAAAARRKAAGLQASLDKAQADNAALTSAASANAAELDKYKAAYDQASAQDHDLAAERDRLKAQLATTGNIASACQAKNVRLIAFAEDLLTAYRKVGFVQVLSAREPMLGLRRVQLENIAQEREDTVRANTCDPRLDAAGGAKPAPVAGGG